MNAVNLAAASAKGEIILLLNNDVFIKPDSVRVACDILRNEPDVGAVGGKIVRLDGTLQQAGGTVFQNGTVLDYGRGHSPHAAEFQFRRDVDYCSGALLFVRRSLFEKIGRFDPIYASYCEDADLCLRILDAGYRIVYAPKVEGAHFEFAGMPYSQNALVSQRRKRTIFRNRHRARLSVDHFPSWSRLLEARMRSPNARRILVIDDRIPYPYLGSGCPRANSMLGAIHSAGWFVTFYPLIHPAVNWTQAYDLLSPDIEIIPDLGITRLQDFLSDRVGYYKAALISRPHNMQYFSDAVRHVPKFLATTKLIYDAEAIFAVRDALRLTLRGISVSIDDRKKNLASEIALTTDAAVILVVSEREAQLFQAGTSTPVQILGHSVIPAPTPATFSERSDILFVGALDDDESPNSESIRWFVHEVMPKLDVLLGANYRLKIVGRNSPSIQALAGRRVDILGIVDDLQPVYNSARLCIAPTRFAAGLPMKVHSAAAAGVPVIATKLVAEQLGWRHNVELITADEPEAFAAACHKLYTNLILWHSLRRDALDRVKRDCNPTEFNSRLETVLAAVARQTFQPTRSNARIQANEHAISAMS